MYFYVVLTKKYIKVHLDPGQDFLIRLDMKPCIHPVKISIFSLNLVIVRLTKIKNRAVKNLVVVAFGGVGN